MTSFPRWHTAITNAISKHKGQTVFQLSSIAFQKWIQLGPDPPTPHVRTLVYRKFLAHPHNPAVPLIVGSADVRTSKVEQLEANSNVELAWWIEGTQEQYRISGKAYLFSSPNRALSTLPLTLTKENRVDWENERQELFDSMSSRMKAGWCRPTPGTPLNEHGGKEAAKNWPQHLPPRGEGTEEEKRLFEEALGNFVLLVIEPSEVDFVELAKTPHERTRFWLENGSWREEALVP